MRSLPFICTAAFFSLIFCCLPFTQAVAAECIKSDCQEGFGILELPDGHRYEGSWKDGKPKGKAMLAKGNIYEGEVVDGMWNGQGTMIRPELSGSIFVSS